MLSARKTIKVCIGCLVILLAGCDSAAPAEVFPPGTFTMKVTGELDLELKGSASFLFRQPPSLFWEPRLEVSLTDSTFGTIEFDDWRSTPPPPGRYLICNMPECTDEKGFDGEFSPLFFIAESYRWARGKLEITESSAHHLAGDFEFTILSAQEYGEARSRFTGAFHAILEGN